MPAEYFFTDEKEPQVIIQVDEFPVLCAKLNCGFTYTAQSSEITAFTVVGQSVTIIGIDLPLELASVSLGRVSCTIATNTETEIACTLSHSLPAGSWHP